MLSKTANDFFVAVRCKCPGADWKCSFLYNHRAYKGLVHIKLKHKILLVERLLYKICVIIICACCSIYLSIATVQPRLIF